MNSGDTYIRGSARDKIRGCMIGGAAGDALGYAVEFMGEREIFLKYGANGITSYDIHDGSGKAVISDDTQMSLFTATGLLTGDTRGALHGVRAEPAFYVAKAYGDWLNTQETTFAQFRSRVGSGEAQAFSWLSEVPELFNRRALLHRFGNSKIRVIFRRQIFIKLRKSLLDIFLQRLIHLVIVAHYINFFYHLEFLLSI